MKHDPKLLDIAVLDALTKWSHKATYVIRNSLSMDNSVRWRELKTRHVLTACRRLEKRGLVQEVPSSYLTMLTWEITPAGRQALQEKEGGE